MRPLLVPLALLCLPAATPLPAVAGTEVPVGRFVEWHGGDAVYRSGGVEVAVAAAACPAHDEACPPGWVQPRLTVTAPGLPAARFEVPSTAPVNFPLRIAVGSLDRRAGRPAVLLTQFTGGAHCCESLLALLPIPGGWRRTDLGQWDMEAPSFPRDIDGDGRADFVLPDNRFNYAFASYAESLDPPRVFTLLGGVWTDVSTRPAFAPLFRRHLVKARALCLRPRGLSPAGACAAYAADAARLGHLAGVWPEVMRRLSATSPTSWGYPTGCRVATREDSCPAGQAVSYASYPAALRAFLTRYGYLS